MDGFSMRLTKRLNRFLQGHRRLLLFVGASITLVTFVVKDEIRQDLKDLADSIDSAENVFMIRSDSRDIMEQIMWVQQLIKEQGPRRSVLPPIAYFRSLSAGLNSSVHLLAKVPHGEELDERAAVILLKRNKWMDQSLPPLSPIAERPIPRDSAADAAEESRALESWKEVFFLNGEVQQFGVEVLELAHKVEAQQEHRYRVSKYVSYFLYPLGWLIGLLGTLVGVEGLRDL
jgi:hypothetical protein